MTLEAEVLAQLTPTDAERAEVELARQSLEQDATQFLRTLGFEGAAQVQGSIAKDTWIAGDTDLDCFLVMPLDVPEESLESIVTQVAEATLQAPRKKYAQHPYIIGTRDGFQVDLVPAYRIDSADQRLSAVDRTPLHTEWVRANLDATARQQVRLAKQWCKGVGIYGAETRIGGFSGYLVEVLIQQLGGLEGFLEWAKGGCQPRRIAVFEDHVNDDVSPLVVVDPVDPIRNCAAAVTLDVLARTTDAATAYLESPTKLFFHPNPRHAEPKAVLDSALAQANAQWIGLELVPQTDRLDLVFPQFQRSSRVASDALERAGFAVHRVLVDALDDDGFVGIQWLVDATVLPEHRTHTGPAAAVEPNAGKFRKKWMSHPDRVGDIVVNADGRLEVTLNVNERTPHAWLQANLQSALTGKHVAKALALNPTLLDDPSNANPIWGPIVADFVLARHPWQRP